MPQAAPHDQHLGEPDPVEEIVDVIPWLLPLMGAVLMFLLAFIAVNLA